MYFKLIVTDYWLLYSNDKQIRLVLGIVFWHDALLYIAEYSFVFIAELSFVENKNNLLYNWININIVYTLNKF